MFKFGQLVKVNTAKCEQRKKIKKEFEEKRKKRVEEINKDAEKPCCSKYITPGGRRELVKLIHERREEKRIKQGEAQQKKHEEVNEQYVKEANEELAKLTPLPESADKKEQEALEKKAFKIYQDSVKKRQDYNAKERVLLKKQFDETRERGFKIKSEFDQLIAKGELDKALALIHDSKKDRANEILKLCEERYKNNIKIKAEDEARKSCRDQHEGELSFFDGQLARIVSIQVHKSTDENADPSKEGEARSYEATIMLDRNTLSDQTRRFYPDELEAIE